jgi:hypothetical protein
MVNKDYILRIAERVGRALAVILGLRQANKHEDALIYIDDLLLGTVGLTSSFINSVSEETLLHALAPFGTLNIDKCLWVAALLKAEGDVYHDMDNTTESYYRYLKALNLFLEVQLSEKATSSSTFYGDIETLLKQLEEYELPTHTKSKLFPYYELVGTYAKAEDMLFELLGANDAPQDIKEQGLAFYQRLQQKSNADLAAGNLSREEITEGIAQLRQ